VSKVFHFINNVHQQLTKAVISNCLAVADDNLLYQNAA